jgi:NAD(P)-dependent dehydrogenase (short-subunit alcohol dehydrogenase family)
MGASAIQHSDKVALVTGAASGIGRATALAFAQSGVKVVLADITIEAGEGAAVEINRQTDVPTSFVKCDVSKSADVERMVRHAVERFGRLDYAFNNAGTEGMQAPTAECSEENWDRTVAIDLKGTWLCMIDPADACKREERSSTAHPSRSGGLSRSCLRRQQARRDRLTKTAA